MVIFCLCLISLKSGVADVRHMLDRKLKIGLGTGNIVTCLNFCRVYAIG